MPTPNERLEAINDANLQLWALARNEMSPEEHAATKPEPATWDDVEEMSLYLPSFAARMRSPERAALTKSEEALRRLANIAADAEERWSDHVATNEHQGWLRDGGPARLWEVLGTRKRRHEEVAALVEARAADFAAYHRAAAAECQRLMDEMVRLYLGQEAAE